MIYQSPCLIELEERGLISYISDPEGLDAKMMEGPITAYLGIDCTNNHIHIGHLLPIMVAILLVRHSHKVIIMIGTTTAHIGDPAGRDKSRPELSWHDISNNRISLLSELEAFFEKNSFKGSRNKIDNLQIVQNHGWLNELFYLDFLRCYGKYFSIEDMLALESVKERLDRESPMTFAEFNYPLLQAYDFLELNRRYNCILQIGGSDQWDNISRGISLGNRLDKELFGITTPLLLAKDGKKMGKTENGIISLYNSSAYEIGMFFYNMPDDLVKKWWGYVMDKNKPFDSNCSIASNKILLANKILSMASRMKKLRIGPNDKIYDEHIQYYHNHDRFCDIIVNARMASSIGEAKRLIQQGAVSILDTKDFKVKFKITNPLYSVSDYWESNKSHKVILQVGKKICLIHLACRAYNINA